MVGVCVWGCGASSSSSVSTKRSTSVSSSIPDPNMSSCLLRWDMCFLKLRRSFSMPLHTVPFQDCRLIVGLCFSVVEGNASFPVVGSLVCVWVPGCSAGGVVPTSCVCASSMVAACSSCAVKISVVCRGRKKLVIGRIMDWMVVPRVTLCFLVGGGPSRACCCVSDGFSVCWLLTFSAFVPAGGTWREVVALCCRRRFPMGSLVPPFASFLWLVGPGGWMGPGSSTSWMGSGTSSFSCSISIVSEMFLIRSYRPV